jgi:prophage DNA circulation protein
MSDQTVSQAVASAENIASAVVAALPPSVTTPTNTSADFDAFVADVKSAFATISSTVSGIADTVSDIKSGNYTAAVSDTVKTTLAVAQGTASDIAELKSTATAGGSLWGDIAAYFQRNFHLLNKPPAS